MAVFVTHHQSPKAVPSCLLQSHRIDTSSLPLSQFNMATLPSIGLASPVSQSLQQPRFLSGLTSWAAYRSGLSPFNGQSLHLPGPQLALRGRTLQKFGLIKMMVKPTIQFVQGTDEQTVPNVRLTKSKDGTNGMAIFSFDQPSIFDASADVGDITGFYMIDEEGVLQSTSVSAKFINGKPSGIEAKYILQSPREWDRFMRFMERYANANGLSFVKS